MSQGCARNDTTWVGCGCVAEVLYRSGGVVDASLLRRWWKCDVCGRCGECCVHIGTSVLEEGFSRSMLFSVQNKTRGYEVSGKNRNAVDSFLQIHFFYTCVAVALFVGGMTAFVLQFHQWPALLVVLAICLSMMVLLLCSLFGHSEQQ